MSDKILKQVRITNENDNEWLLVINEVNIFGKKSARITQLYTSDFSKIPLPNISKKYDSDVDNDTIIKEYLAIVNETSSVGFYVVQDPYKDEWIKPINYGKDIYYLNIDDVKYNYVVEIRIYWKINNKITNGIKYFNKSDKYKNIFGINYEIVEVEDEYIKNNKEKFDINNKGEIEKIVEIKYASDVILLDSNPMYIYYTDKDNNFTENINDSKKFSGTNSDLDIIEQVLNSWRKNVGNDYDIKLVSIYSDLFDGLNFKDYNKVKFINPIIGKNDDKKEISNSDDNSSNSSEKIKLNLVGLKDGFNIQSKEEFGFEVIVGDVVVDVIDGINGEDLSDEYTESDFIGLDEEELKVQKSVADDIDPDEQKDNTYFDGYNANDVNIIPKTLDELLKVAGTFVQVNKGGIYSKNTRVSYENLKKNYIEGVHGLCPQGTRAVMYALIGDKKVATIAGNADWFSFKKPGTGGGNASFVNTGYYENKVKVGKKDYIDDKSAWKIGDVLACGYTEGKAFGHIQVWTGWCWMSDFKQNRIQIYNIDYDTLALWRVNEKGAQKIKSRLG